MEQEFANANPPPNLPDYLHAPGHTSVQTSLSSVCQTEGWQRGVSHPGPLQAPTGMAGDGGGGVQGGVGWDGGLLYIGITKQI